MSISKWRTNAKPEFFFILLSFFLSPLFSFAVMAEDLRLFIKDSLLLRSPKKPSIWLRMILLMFAMMCALYICIGCLKQIRMSSNVKLPNIQVVERPCDITGIESWEKPFVHFPNPVTFRRAECACNPVRYFAILSTQRSGSGWFETLLNSHVNISSNGEIFSVKPRRSNASTIVETLDKIYNLDWLTSASKNKCTAAVGLKWMLNQGLVQNHEEILKYFDRQGVSAIFLFRRNLLRRLISLLANSYDRNAKLLNGTHKSHVHSTHDAEILAKYKPFVNTTQLIPSLNRVDEMAANALEYFKSTRHMVLYYEDIVKNRSKLLEVQDFLKVPRMRLSSRQVKIHNGPISQQIENWEDVEKTLVGTQYESFLYT